MRASTVRRWVDRLGTLNSVVAVVVFVLLTVVVSLQVLTRFVFHTPLIWSEEVARFLFFWVVLLGSAMSVRTRRHFVIDVMMRVDGEPGRFGGGLFARVLPNLFVLAFSSLLLVEGLGYTRVGLLRTATNSQLNMVWVYAAIPVFAALTIVYSLANLVVDFAGSGDPGAGGEVPSGGRAGGEVPGGGTARGDVPGGGRDEVPGGGPAEDEGTR